MTSNINPNNIDGTYPVAGVDNDSQGFRTNFTNIKNNFVNAATEISDLQGKVVLTSALTGGTLNNNFAGTPLSGATIKDFRETRYDLQSLSGSVVLNHQNGHYQTVTTTGSISLSFINLPPAGSLGRIRLEVNVANTAHTMTVPSTVSVANKGIPGFSSQIITFNETGVYTFEFTTYDAGNTITMRDLTRPKDYFYSDHLTIQPRYISNDIGQAGDVAGQIVVDTTTPAIWLSTAAYDGTSHIWRKAELESINNEVFLDTNATTTSNTFATIAGSTATFSFTARANTQYVFDAFLAVQHTAGSVNKQWFSIGNGGNGSLVVLVQQQTAANSALTAQTITGNANTLANVTTAESNVTRVVRINGTYKHTADQAVTFLFKTDGGTLTVLNGSYVRFNRK
jgi:hypothetical protein